MTKGGTQIMNAKQIAEVPDGFVERDMSEIKNNEREDFTMKKKSIIKKVLAFALSCCMILAVIPMTALAAGNDEETTFVPKRIFIEEPNGRPDEEILQKASLVSQEFVAKDICKELPVVYGDKGMAEDGDILVWMDSMPGETDGTSDDSQNYNIYPENGRIQVTAKSAVGVRDALRDVLKMLDLGGIVAEKHFVPDVEQRIFHLDCGRKYFSKEFIISLVKELSWLQMNQLELDFSNGTGFRLELDDMTLDVNGGQKDISGLPGGTTDEKSWLTQNDMDEIIETAEQYGVEIVPCLDTPGHMGWIFSHGDFAEYSANGELDVENAEAAAFGKALVKKFAAYFVSRGCTTFHIGGDEFLHAYVGWLGHPASTEDKYGAVADYLDSLAGELKEMGYTKIRAFNDPLYYKNNTTEHTWINVDEAEYWCYTGMNGFNYSSPTFLGEQGIHLINGHGDFYNIMADDNWQKPVGDAGTKKTPAGIYAQFHNNTFAQGAQTDDQYIYGSTYFLWCDNPNGGTVNDVVKSLYPRLRAVAAKMCDEDAADTWEAFSASFTDSVGGFLADGSVQDVTLPVPPEIKPAVTENQKAVDAVVDKINAIGNVTELSSLQIAAARKAYDALTAEQKLMVSAEILQKLENAEKKLAELQKQAYDVSGAVLSAIAVQTYTGQPIAPAFAVTLNGKVLVKDKDYTVVYKNNVNPGTASFTVSGKGDYSGTILGSFFITIPKGALIKVGNYKYKVINPALDGSGTAAFAGVVKPAGTVKIASRVSVGGISFSVTEIIAKALQGDKKISKVTIGANVRKIGSKAFYKCAQLKTVRISSKKLTSKSVGKKAFGKISVKAAVKVPKSKKSAYKKFLFKKGLPKKAKIK